MCMSTRGRTRVSRCLDTGVLFTAQVPGRIIKVYGAQGSRYIVCTECHIDHRAWIMDDVYCSLYNVRRTMKVDV